MIGDKLLITDYHRAGAEAVFARLTQVERRDGQALAVTVAGESGSGKSEIAQCLKDLITAAGMRCLVLGQDDYFRLPPRSNHEKRLSDISWVGSNEVRLDLLDEHLASLKRRSSESITKPLVYFAENRIGQESIGDTDVDVVIAEGTYTTMLEEADLRAFIDRTYRQNRKNRLKRNRDPDPEFLERVLAIEHEIISKHRALADVVIPAPEEERQKGV